MGLIILLSAVALETVLVVYRVRSGSRARRVVAGARLAWSAGLLLLLGARLLAWGPRYGALLVVSLLLAAHGLVVLLRARASDEPIPPWRAIRHGALVVLLLLVATLPAIVFPAHEPLPSTGAHPVATATDTYVDPTRTGRFTDDGQPRRLTVGFWYPDVPPAGPDAGYPLLVYSHGGTGTRTANRTLFAELASHGYVVASVDHPGHSLFTTDADGRTTWIDRTYWRELNQEDARADRQASLRSYRRWLQVRIDDLDLVLDRVVREAARAEPMTPYALVDVDRIGVLGHSLGGAAALAVGRIRDDIGAVVALESPMLWDIEGVADGEFVWNPDPYPVPVLHVYSDSSWEHLAEWPQYAANQALRQGADATVVTVHLAGVGHFGLTDLALTSPLLTRLLDGENAASDPAAALLAVNEVTLDFVDTQLRDGAGLAERYTALTS
ncbi:MAG: alpha/beta hydrolase family protein [Nitriliruptoraceae bacterium]